MVDLREQAAMLSAIQPSIDLLAFLFLIRKRTAAPHRAQWLLVLGFLLNILILVAIWTMTHRVNWSSVVFASFIQVWFAYLRFSRRGAITYGGSVRENGG
jgi:heme/copper-type cytochrome/quinol oxidase subunit 4